MNHLNYSPAMLTLLTEMNEVHAKWADLNNVLNDKQNDVMHLLCDEFDVQPGRTYHHKGLPVYVTVLRIHVAQVPKYHDEECIAPIAHVVYFDSNEDGLRIGGTMRSVDFEIFYDTYVRKDGRDG